MTQLNVGDEVSLRFGIGLASHGRLSAIFLDEEGYRTGMTVPITDVITNEGRGAYTVQLPSGYNLKITQSDIS